MRRDVLLTMVVQAIIARWQKSGRSGVDASVTRCDIVFEDAEMVNDDRANNEVPCFGFYYTNPTLNCCTRDRARFLIT
jgi:hypothetical protein